MRDHPEHDVAMAGIRGPLRLEDILFMARKANRIAPLQVLRADRVVGPDHLLSAAMHAQRAFTEGRNQADRLDVEFARYAAGERQIRKAIDKMGVTDGSDGIVITFGDKRNDALRYFIDGLGLIEDDALLEGGHDALLAFGITQTELDATTDGLASDLVLEKVASVDLMRK